MDLFNLRTMQSKSLEQIAFDRASRALAASEYFSGTLKHSKQSAGLKVIFFVEGINLDMNNEMNFTVKVTSILQQYKKITIFIKQIYLK